MRTKCLRFACEQQGAINLSTNQRLDTHGITGKYELVRCSIPKSDCIHPIQLRQPMCMLPSCEYIARVALSRMKKRQNRFGITSSIPWIMR